MVEPLEEIFNGIHDIATIVGIEELDCLEVGDALAVTKAGGFKAGCCALLELQPDDDEYEAHLE